MKPTILVFFVVILALAVASDNTWESADSGDIEVSANHHKMRRGNNMKTEEYSTTFDPSEGDNGDGGDFEWPQVERIRNFDLPNDFGPGRSDSTRSEAVPAKHHGKSGHGSHSH